MPTYLYKPVNNTTVTLLGTDIRVTTDGVSFNTDNTELNGYVPEVLDRYIDGALNNNIVQTGAAPQIDPLTNSQLRATAVATEPLGIPTVARQLSATATSQSEALASTCRRVSIRARGCDIRYVIGVGAQTANASTSHFLAQDERLDWAVPAGAHIARIRDSAATADGLLAVTEIG